MNVIVADDVSVLKSYLGLREAAGLFHKQRWHMFVSSDRATLDVIYRSVEFQYHAETGTYTSLFYGLFHS